MAVEIFFIAIVVDEDYSKALQIIYTLFPLPNFFTEAANAEINVFIFWSMFTIDLC